MSYNTIKDIHTCVLSLTHTNLFSLIETSLLFYCVISLGNQPRISYKIT